MEGPDDAARADVEGSKIAGRGAVALIGGGAEDQQILENAAGRGGLHQRKSLGIAAKTLLQIDGAVGSEGRNDLAGTGVDGAQEMIAGEEQTAV